MIPSYELQLGSVTIDPSQNDDLEELDAQVSLDAPVDSLAIIARRTDDLSSLKNGDPVSLKLGYESDLQESFAGEVGSLELGFSSIKITSLSPIVKLLRLRLNQVYLNQTAGEIVKDLCDKSQVTPGDVQDGVTLPSFVVSHEVPAYEYARTLAENSGFDLYITPDNKLSFKEYSPEQVHDLEFGLDVLGVEVARHSSLESVRVYGESPSSKKGSDTSHWLTKDNIEGSAGSGDAIPYSDPTIRDQDTANAVAKSLLATSKHAIHLTVRTIGNSDLKLGDAISLKGFDHDLLKGEFKIRSLDHSLSKSSGFITRVSCSREV